MKKISIVFVEMYSVLFSFKRVLSHAGILINEKFSWYLPSFFFLHLNPIRFVSCFMFHHSFQFYNFWHFRVSAQPLSGDWKNHLLFLKNSFCQKLDFFLLNLHWNIYVRHQEHWTAKTITKHRLKYFDFFSRENIKIILTLTGWKCSENCQISSQSLLSTNSASEKTAKFFSKWSNYEKFISQRKVWYIFQYKKF